MTGACNLFSLLFFLFKILFFHLCRLTNHYFFILLYKKDKKKEIEGERERERRKQLKTW